MIFEKEKQKSSIKSLEPFIDSTLNLNKLSFIIMLPDLLYKLTA
jgi:hypothetical protein